MPAFGSIEAGLLIVGMAPGLKGANRTGRPFTGDGAGELLYPTLIEFGLAHGDYDRRPDDGLVLRDCRITNAVRCVPPQNKITGSEATRCRSFLADEIASMARLRTILALGLDAHKAVLSVFGARKAVHVFAHGAVHALPDGLTLVDSYHCSRYNTNTGRLTPAMFRAVFTSIRDRMAEGAETQRPDRDSSSKFDR
ncbi:MAG: uracil-DNA glycosylase [Inquilinaceae bacterium]